MSNGMPWRAMAALTSSRALGGIRALRRTPARSSCIGTRTLTLAAPPGSLALTSTRKYFGALLELAAGAELSWGVGPTAMASSRRSASSAVILPAASMPRMRLRSSFMTRDSFSKDAEAYAGAGGLDVDAGSRHGEQHGADADGGPIGIDAAHFARNRQQRGQQQGERRQQDPQRRQRQPKTDGNGPRDLVAGSGCAAPTPRAGAARVDQ